MFPLIFCFPGHAPEISVPPDELNAVICVSQQIGTLALTVPARVARVLTPSMLLQAGLLPWTTREAATMIILHYLCSYGVSQE